MDKHLEIQLYDGNHVDDKIAWGLGEIFKLFPSGNF